MIRNVERNRIYEQLFPLRWGDLDSMYLKMASWKHNNTDIYYIIKSLKLKEISSVFKKTNIKLENKYELEWRIGQKIRH